MVQFLVGLGAHTFVENHTGDTPLGVATTPEIIDFLIGRGLDIEEENSFGETPFLQTAISKNFAALRALAQRGANIHRKTNDGRSAVFFLCNPPPKEASALFVENLKAMEFLLQNGVNVNDSDIQGEAPIHRICHWGYEEAIPLLLQYGAYINDIDFQWNTPLHIAARHGTPVSFLKKLIQYGADPFAENKQKRRPIDLATTPEGVAFLRTIDLKAQSEGLAAVKVSTQSPYWRENEKRMPELQNDPANIVAKMLGLPPKIPAIRAETTAENRARIRAMTANKNARIAMARRKVEKQHLKNKQAALEREKQAFLETLDPDERAAAAEAWRGGRRKTRRKKGVQSR